MSDDEFEDQEELEEHLEAVKPEPVDEDELDELVEPSTELETVQDEEQASVDEAARSSAGAAGATEVDSELNVLAEPVTEFQTAQEQDAADEDGGGDE